MATALYAQKTVTKFLGIPVDGTKTAMIQQLEAKGYQYNSTMDVLTQLLPFELFSKKFCLNISELGLEIV